MSLTSLKGVGPKTLALLNKLNIKKIDYDDVDLSKKLLKK